MTANLRNKLNNFIFFKLLEKGIMKRLGYQAARHASQCNILIKEIEGLYKGFLFPDLVLSDEKELLLMANLLGIQIGEALYIKNFLLKSLKMKGDICEFGIAQGATSAFIAYLIRETKKNIWLFDSFKGLPRPSKKDVLINDIFNLGSMEAYEGKMACGKDMVKRRLREINFPEIRTRIVAGFIEETIKSFELPKEVCFAYVDFDLYEPILITLNFLDKTLEKGGFIVVDDYGFFSTGIKIAVDEFICAHKDKYSFSLPVKSTGCFCIIERKV